MTVDTVTLIYGISIIVLAILTSLCNPFFWYPKEREEEQEDDDRQNNGDPNVSVVVVAHNGAENLEQNISLLLSQQYEGKYEVVVVAEQGDLQTENVLKKFISNNIFHFTFTPSHPLFMSRQKLAVTLGVKASQYDWILLIDADSAPATETWISLMAQHFKPETDLVIGTCNYNQRTKGYYRFLQLRDAGYFLRQAQSHTAFAAAGKNIAFRKSMFIENDGYRGNLQYVNGEYDFIVNKYAQKGNTDIVLSSKATIRQNTPTRKSWIDAHLCQINIQSALKRSMPYKIWHGIDFLAIYINYIAIIALGVYSGLVNNWVLLGMTLSALLITICLRILFAQRVIRQQQEDIPAWKAFFYESALIFHAASCKLRYVFADKSGFTSHKL